MIVSLWWPWLLRHCWSQYIVRFYLSLPFFFHNKILHLWSHPSSILEAFQLALSNFHGYHTIAHLLFVKILKSSPSFAFNVYNVCLIMVPQFSVSSSYRLSHVTNHRCFFYKNLRPPNYPISVCYIFLVLATFKYYLFPRPVCFFPIPLTSGVFSH